MEEAGRLGGFLLQRLENCPKTPYTIQVYLAEKRDRILVRTCLEEKRMESKHQRSSFTGSIGFVLAAAGSAVGLGNIWRFPYLAAKDGGGVFLLCYLILALTFGFTLLTSEIAIGRKTGQSPLTAYRMLHPKWGWLGVAACLVPVIILPYYCTIGGWVLKYLATYLSGGAEAAMADGYFTGFITSAWSPIFWFIVFLGGTLAVVYKGVDTGIERFSRVLMPLLLLLILMIAAFSLTLTHTDAAGIHSHGLKNLRGYIHKMQLGAMNPRGEAEVLREKGALALLDAHDALGTVGTTAAMDKAIALGKEHGLALVTVKNSSHFGAPFLFPARAAEAGLIALLLTNTDPNTGVPDGRGRVIGNNPLCYALPWQGHHPVVLDISLSATAAMKIIRASTRGEKLTDNVLYDLNGHYTDDPAWFFKGGALAPVGAHKGYGLSVLFEALTSVLSGGTPGTGPGRTLRGVCPGTGEDIWQRRFPLCPAN